MCCDNSFLIMNAFHWLVVWASIFDKIPHIFFLFRLISTIIYSWVDLHRYHIFNDIFMFWTIFTDLNELRYWFIFMRLILNSILSPNKSFISLNQRKTLNYSFFLLSWLGTLITFPCLNQLLFKIRPEPIGISPIAIWRSRYFWEILCYYIILGNQA